MEGVNLEKSATGSLCFTVENISDELKNIVRARLSEICHGAAKAARTSSIYSYKKIFTLFSGGFDDKPPVPKKGMIGDCLTLVIF